MKGDGVFVSVWQTFRGMGWISFRDNLEVRGVFACLCLSVGGRGGWS